MVNTEFTKSLNDILKDIDNPNISKDKLSRLSLPTGLLVKKPNKLNCINMKLCYSDNCISEEIHSKLIDLVEYKDDTKSKQNVNDNHSKKKRKPTKKKRHKKREKTTRKK